MLGVVRNPTMTPSDEVMKQVAGEMGIGHTFGMAPVGVFFGRDGRKEPGMEADDPFFGGVGPSRRGCLETGECMTGCRHNAKNTLAEWHWAAPEFKLSGSKPLDQLSAGAPWFPAAGAGSARRAAAALAWLGPPRGGDA